MRSVPRARGVLDRLEAEGKLRLTLHPPAPDLAMVIEHHWCVAWDLRGQEPHRQETLPHPCVHLVFGDEGAAVHGVMTARFAIVLAGEGRVFGVKFRPGAFAPLSRVPVAGLTDAVASLADALGPEANALESGIRGSDSDLDRIAAAESFLRSRVAVPDEALVLVQRLVELIVSSPELTKVDELVERTGVAKRRLQRLFDKYIGVSPKYVIQRYRLIEAVERLATRDPGEWGRIAYELGYVDQAHFIKDFKTVVGRSPAEYARAARVPGARPR